MKSLKKVRSTQPVTDGAIVDPFVEWKNALTQWAPPKAARGAGRDNGDSWASSVKWFRSTRGDFDTDRDPFFTLLSLWLTPTTTVLDVGAGAGRLSLPIAAKVAEVIAVEASAGMREALNEAIATQGIGNVQVVAGKWPEVEVGPVDIAVCANVLYDIPDLRPFLAKLIEVARGACFIYLTAKHPYDSFRELWQEFRGWTPPDKPTWEDAIRCIRELGVEPQIGMVPSRRTLSFASLEEAVAYARFRLELADDPPELQRLQDYLAKRGGQNEGRWVWPFSGSQGVILWWKT